MRFFVKIPSHCTILCLSKFLSHAGIVETFDRLRNRSNKSRGEGNTKPLYINGVQRYFRSPLSPNRVTPIRPIRHSNISYVDTFDINSIRQGLVPILRCAVAPYSFRARQRPVGARSSSVSFLYLALYVTGSCSRPLPPRVSRVPESLCTNCSARVSLPL